MRIILFERANYYVTMCLSERREKGGEGDLFLVNYLLMYITTSKQLVNTDNFHCCVLLVNKLGLCNINCHLNFKL